MANGSAAAGAIEGFLSGVQAGSQFRRQRTADKQTAEEIRNRRIAEELQRGRQEVTDEQAAAAEAREAAGFELETGLAPGRDEEVPAHVGQLRRDVGADQMARSGAPVPAGFRRVGPSADERAQEEAIGLRRRSGEFLADPANFDISDDRNFLALEESNLLDDFLRQREAATRPDPTSPLQRMTGLGGLEFTFDPRGEVGERVAPLLGPEGDQFRSRVPDDNFARRNAQAAANAISRIDRLDFFGDDEAVAAEGELVAQRFGFDSADHVQQTLRGAVGGGGERSPGELWDAAAEELGSEEEAQRVLGPRPSG